MLGRFLARFGDHAYALLRLVAGLMFAAHGAQKVFGVLGGTVPRLGSQIWIGGVIELVCGIAIAVGLMTRWAALLAAGTMAVAYVQFHWKLQGGLAALPIVNKGEMAALYALLFLYVACRGGGRWSVGKDG